MKSQKNTFSKSNQLHVNSRLCLQLGILLALVVVYVGFESTFSKELINAPVSAMVPIEPEVYVFPPFAIEENKIEKKTLIESLPSRIEDFIIDENDLVPEIILNPELSPAPVDFDVVFKDVPDYPETIDEPYIFVVVEQAPRFPGCKEDSEEAYRACFNQKIKKFVSKKFNTNVDIGIQGKQKIIVLFKIDQDGNIVNIRAKAPHKRLEKEAIKAVEKLPKMIPAKQRNRNVAVKYTLPIVFYIE